MFLNELNDAQKRAMLVLASRITQADGEDSADEHEALDALCNEMEIPFEFDQRAVLADIDVSMFDSHRARVIAGLELMRMLHADDYIHEAELAEIKAICRAFKFPEPWVATMTEWAKRMAWTEEDPLDHQRAEYHDALVTYANRIMDDIWR
ncbi:MAG: hypothetical protein KAH11_07635 [Rhodospirillales bacterium]|nr:hypothetical protein [Rhodospirillales bacterium]